MQLESTDEADDVNGDDKMQMSADFPDDVFHVTCPCLAFKTVNKNLF